MTTRFLKLPMSLDGDVYIPTDSDDFEGKISLELAIDQEDLSNELIQSPQKQFFWYSAASFLKVKVDEAEDAIKRLKADLFCSFKARKTNEGRVPSDDLVKNLVERDERLENATTEMRNAQNLLAIAEAAKWAFKDRHQVLITLAHKERAEWSITTEDTSVTGNEPRPGGGRPRAQGKGTSSRRMMRRESEQDLEQSVNALQSATA